MGRRRKHDITIFKKGTRGKVSHERKDLIAEVFGEVDKSGSTYISKDLKGFKTVTYVFLEEEYNDKPDEQYQS